LKDSAIGDELRVENVEVQERSRAAGKSLAELNVRKETGALVVAIRRDGNLVEDLDPAEALRPGDRIYLVGRSQAVRKAVALLSAG
jgi:K+/H+ antiporter YhaU regulatory subunit KhtT